MYELCSISQTKAPTGSCCVMPFRTPLQRCSEVDQVLSLWPEIVTFLRAALDLGWLCICFWAMHDFASVSGPCTVLRYGRPITRVYRRVSERHKEFCMNVSVLGFWHGQCPKTLRFLFLCCLFSLPEILFPGCLKVLYVHQNFWTILKRRQKEEQSVWFAYKTWVHGKTAWDQLPELGGF